MTHPKVWQPRQLYIVAASRSKQAGSQVIGPMRYPSNSRGLQQRHRDDFRQRNRRDIATLAATYDFVEVRTYRGHYPCSDLVASLRERRS